MGVVLRQLSYQYPDIESKYFWNVPAAMNSLVLEGLLPTNAGLVRDLAEAEPFLYPVIISFLVLAVITIMNMLLGVLVEVVAAVAATEKEGMTVSAVSQQLRQVMVETLDINIKNPILKADFRSLLLKPEINSILVDVKVDVIGLMEAVDVIYEDLERHEPGKGMSFEDFVELVLNMRGTNQATVKDTKELIRLMNKKIEEVGNTITKAFEEELTQLRQHMEQMKDDSSDGGSHRGFNSALSRGFSAGDDDFSDVE